MAIAYTNSADLGFQFSPSLTTAFNCTGGNILYVGGWGDTAGDNWTGVTYNGVAMTRLFGFLSAVGRWFYLYQLNSPSSGSNNVVVSSSTSGGIQAVAWSASGAATSGQPDSSNSFDGTSASINPSTTVVASNSWLFSICYNMDTAGGGTIMRGSSANGISMFDSNGTVGTGSQSLNMSNSGGPTTYSSAIVSIKPTGATVITNPAFILNFI